MTNLTPELTVMLPVIILQFITPLVLVCIAAYFGARKGAGVRCATSAITASRASNRSSV